MQRIERRKSGTRPGPAASSRPGGAPGRSSRGAAGRRGVGASGLVEKNEVNDERYTETSNSAPIPPPLPPSPPPVPPLPSGMDQTKSSPEKVPTPEVPEIPEIPELPVFATEFGDEGSPFHPTESTADDPGKFPVNDFPPKKDNSQTQPPMPSNSSQELGVREVERRRRSSKSIAAFDLGPEIPELPIALRELDIVENPEVPEPPEFSCLNPTGNSVQTIEAGDCETRIEEEEEEEDAKVGSPRRNLGYQELPRSTKSQKESLGFLSGGKKNSSSVQGHQRRQSQEYHREQQEIGHERTRSSSVDATSSSSSRSLAGRRPLNPRLDLDRSVRGTGVDPVPSMESPAHRIARSVEDPIDFDEYAAASTAGGHPATDDKLSNTGSITGEKPSSSNRAGSVNSESKHILEGLGVEAEEEIRRLRARLRAQDAEIRHVKRVTVIHSMFFKWKVWHMYRIQERMEAAIEEERIRVAERIQAAAKRLHSAGEYSEFSL